LQIIIRFFSLLLAAHGNRYELISGDVIICQLYLEEVGGAIGEKKVKAASMFPGRPSQSARMLRG
jgi:hypothetical protein